MQKIILIKTHPSIQLAHLYEHLYCTRLKELFYEHGLYKYLDFAMSGTTFDHGGLVEIDIELYTPKAIALGSELQHQKISPDQTSISTTFTQILAEEEFPVNTTGLDNVSDTLLALDQLPWQHIDDFDVLDAKTSKQQKKPVYIDYSHHLPTRKITTKLLLNQEFTVQHRELIPLFRHLAKLITFTVQDQLSLMHGYYYDEVSFHSKVHRTYLQAILKVANLNNDTVDLERDIKHSKHIVNKLRSTGAFDRLLRELKMTSYSERFWVAPNTYDNFDETAVYIGSKGWQRLATPGNLASILENTTLEMQFGPHKLSSTLN